MFIDLLLYITATLLTLWLLLNLAVYLYLRWWVNTNLCNLKRVMEDNKNAENEV